MPVSGNYGTPSNPYGDLYSSYWQYTGYTSDPAHTEGDMWLRTDLASGDKIATLRFDHGSGVWDIPVFATSETPDSKIKKVWRIQTPNGEGFIPLYEQGGAFNEIGFQHAGTRHGVHDSLSAIPDSRISRWEFEQDVSDSWGNNDGTLNGGSYTTNAAVGSYAVVLDGTDDYAGIPDVNEDSGKDFSVSAWVHPDSFPNTLNYIFCREGNTSGIILRADDTGTVSGRIYDGTASAYVSVTGGTLSTSEYTHLDFVCDNQNEIRMYVNGSQNDSASIGDRVKDTSDMAVQIGAQQTESGATPQQYWDGRIDDVRFYDKPHSDTEASNLYSTGSIIG